MNKEPYGDFTDLEVNINLKNLRKKLIQVKKAKSFNII